MQSVEKGESFSLGIKLTVNKRCSKEENDILSETLKSNEERAAVNIHLFYTKNIYKIIIKIEPIVHFPFNH